MTVVWTDFVDKVKHWAERESNDLSVKFMVENLDDDNIRIIAIKDKKVCKVKYSKREYTLARTKHTDQDIIPILFQILKEKYRPVRWSVVGKGGKSFAWPQTILSK